MPTKSRNEVQKKTFKLWIEFLRRSKDYKAFCEWYRNRSKMRRNKKFMASSPYWLKQGLNFPMFGDIHDPNYSFEKWWNDFEKQQAKIEKRHKPIISGLELIEQCDALVHFFKTLKCREPTVNEVKHLWLTDDGGSCIMKVNISGNSPEELRQQFKRLILAKKREPIVKEEDRTIKRHWKPSTGYIRFDELERYLSVYDKFSDGMSVNEIADSDDYYKIHNADWMTKKREIYMDIEKAERIIKNVEAGNFPGKYEKVKAKIG